MDQALAFMTGTIALIAGLSLVFRAPDWFAWIKYLRQNSPATALWLGYLHLILGTFILGFHPKWQGIPLIITLIGAKATLEGIVYLLFPNALSALLAWYETLPLVWFRFAGLITILIGLVLLMAWRAPEWPERASNHCFYQECAVGYSLSVTHALIHDRTR
ncbi:MAG: DUF2065 domain-containing protein [Alphaproteobacteria bacterium]|nr:DUF2065 domain-containing protein [Alphaproteobacteria bacterium]